MQTSDLESSMKTSFLLALSLTLVACSGGDGGGSGGSTPLSVDEPAMGTHPPGDLDTVMSEHDVYELTAPAAGTYRIDLTGDPDAQVSKCDTPEFCYCIPHETCCTIEAGASECTFELPLGADETIYLVTSNFGSAEASYSFTVTGPLP